MKLTPTEQRIAELQEKLQSWNSFVRALDVPADLAPAFVTERPELLKLAQPRALTVDECRVLYDLIAGLFETNAALRLHAQLVADLATTIHQALKGSLHACERMRTVAEFGDPQPQEV